MFRIRTDPDPCCAKNFPKARKKIVLKNTYYIPQAIYLSLALMSSGYINFRARQKGLTLQARILASFCSIATTIYSQVCNIKAQISDRVYLYTPKATSL